MNDNPVMNRINMIPKSLSVDLELPVNSFRWEVTTLSR